MYLLNEIKHDVHMYNAMRIILRCKRFNDVLEIDILRNSLCTKYFGTPEGRFLRVCVSKWHPDALLA